ncbi:MAG: hypothetical protein AB1758_34275 [Candidatus Eremiobacterota bacterium]
MATGSAMPTNPQLQSPGQYPGFPGGGIPGGGFGYPGGGFGFPGGGFGFPGGGFGYPGGGFGFPGGGFGFPGTGQAAAAAQYQMAAADAQQAQTMMVATQMDAQKQEMERWNIMRQAQTKIFELMNDANAYQAKTNHTCNAKWSQVMQA